MTYFFEELLIIIFCLSRKAASPETSAKLHKTNELETVETRLEMSRIYL